MDNFILNGSLLFVAEINDPHTRNGRTNARLRVIFDNGTEGDNLLRSLTAELYKEGPAGRGMRVTAADDGPLFAGNGNAGSGHSAGKQDSRDTSTRPSGNMTGSVYIVRSLSEHSVVKSLAGLLYKIGFTSGTVEQRIASAKDDPTFLFAEAVPVKSYDAYNINVSKMEPLLHRFFGDAQLDIEIADRFGTPCKPKEWFCVRLSVVDEAVRMLLDGSIVRHRYNRENSRIEAIDI